MNHDRRRRTISHLVQSLCLTSALIAGWPLVYAADVKHGEDAASVQQTEHGILLNCKGAHVELAAATPTAMRLSISCDGPPKPAPSFFLDLSAKDARAAAAWAVVEKDGFVGIRAQAGELLVDPQTGRWALHGSQGEVLIPPTGIVGGPEKDAKSGESLLTITVGRRESTPVKAYGSGTSKTHELFAGGPGGRTRVSAGGAVIPYYWSPAGYAALAVTADDRNPAWRDPGEDPIKWRFPGTEGDLYLMPAADFRAAARAYGQLSGRPDVPPRWTFGYLQCRWGWVDRAYIEDALRQFRDRHLPVDAFIYDFEWYTGYLDYKLPPEGAADFTDFGWNPQLFPEPAKQIAAYKAQGVRFVGIRKPRINNTELLHKVWDNGWKMHPDVYVNPNPNQDAVQRRALNFALPAVRDWYARQLAPLLECGVDGWWNDEGEGTYDCYYYWNLAQQQAQAQHRQGQRFWTINRAFAPGLQRFGVATWTGDIFPSWVFVSRTPTSLLNFSLTGMPYGACDIGGFWGIPSKPSPNSRFPIVTEAQKPKMLTRWMQSGVFYLQGFLGGRFCPGRRPPRQRFACSRPPHRTIACPDKCQAVKWWQKLLR